MTPEQRTMAMIISDYDTRVKLINLLMPDDFQGDDKILFEAIRQLQFDDKIFPWRNLQLKLASMGIENPHLLFGYAVRLDIDVMQEKLDKELKEKNKSYQKNISY